jgi:hypothetical protein
MHPYAEAPEGGPNKICMVLLERQVVYDSGFGRPFDRFDHRAFADGTEQGVTNFNLLGGDPAPPNDPEWMLWRRADDASADVKIHERRLILEQVRHPLRDERAFGVILVPRVHEVSYADVFDEFRSIGRQ